MSLRGFPAAPGDYAMRLLTMTPINREAKLVYYK